MSTLRLLAVAALASGTESFASHSAQSSATCAGSSYAPCSDASSLLQAARLKSSATSDGHAGSTSRARATESVRGASDEGGSYPNVTLHSEVMAVTWFVPPAGEQSAAFYNSTRFEWSSMIGNVRLGDDTFFPSGFWRSPQDPANPEHGVGLASEFGCGGDGADCPPGWGPYTAGSGNGVLGYSEAGEGEPFLKIGVGKLLKGSCPQCADDAYRFNSPYEFAEWPVWTLSSAGADADTMEMVQQSSLNPNWGYRLKKTVRVQANTLIAETELKNTGKQTFTTPQYTHNFLSVDRTPIGPPLQLTFAQNVSDYTEPGVVSQWAWAKPLSDYFEPIAANTLNATVPESPLSAEPPRIKAELAGSSNVDSRASYVASVGDLTVVSKLTPGRLPLYAYNLYVEETAICPEPMQMIELAPSETITWTQQLFFGKFEPVDEGTGRACRGADAEDDSPSYYEDHAHIESLNECKGLCLTQGDCVGVEYSRTTAYGQCKVWIREAGIGASKAVSGSTCVRLVPPASAQQ